MSGFGEPNTGVAGKPATPVVPCQLRLEQSRPNPFQQSTTIAFQISRSEIVNLAVYNIAGQQVKTLFNGMQNAEMHSVTWDARDQAGRLLSAGLYFMRLNANGFTRVTRLALVR